MEQQSFLGRGWTFPPSFNKESGHTNMVEDVEDINQSLTILLSTSLGERIMLPEYGCNLRDFQFEPINASFVAFIKDLVRTASIYYEPRILVENVEVTESTAAETYDGLLFISVDYTVRSTNSRFNFVFPFYQNEAVQEIATLTQTL